MKRSRIYRKLNRVLNPGEIPFISLTAQIQEMEKCRLTWEASAEYGCHPALCASQLEEYFDEEDNGWYVPHHRIIVHIDHIGEMSGRFGVAHEIGHILLHFPEYRKPFVAGRFPKKKIGRFREIKYSQQEEVEANVFAAALCYVRSKNQLRFPELSHVVSDHIAEDQFFVHTLKNEVHRQFLEIKETIDKKFENFTSGSSNQRILLAMRELMPLLGVAGGARVSDSQGKKVWIIEDAGIRSLMRNHTNKIREITREHGDAGRKVNALIRKAEEQLLQEMRL